MERENLLTNSGRLHTTELGARRIGKNLGVGEAEAVAYCRKLLEENDCAVIRRGKNLYCEAEGIRVTVHAQSYTIITAHRL